MFTDTFAGIDPSSAPAFVGMQVIGLLVGIGLTLTLCCDVRIASEQARLSARFVRIGLTPELGSTYFLPQITGLGVAAELILTGRIIDAAEAGRVGLVNRVVPRDALEKEAMAFAADVASRPPLPIGFAKELVALSGRIPFEEGHAKELEASFNCQPFEHLGYSDLTFAPQRAKAAGKTLPADPALEWRPAQGPPRPGQWAWHRGAPADLLPTHRPYLPYLAAQEAEALPAETPPAGG